MISIREKVKSGSIKRGSEVFVFTDNSTAEATMYKGSSRSPLLHQMVLDLRKMEMVGDIIVHFVWISGKRMIHQGTDGLSRGDFSSGVMAGEKFLKFLPLHKSAFERQPGLNEPDKEKIPSLEEIVRGWCPNGKGGIWKVARPKDWFYSVFLYPEGSWIWCPPPALAKIAVEQMCEVKHMFPKSRHIFICPSLMTGIWRKQLGKIADAQISLAQGSRHWPDVMFEPLTIALLKPLLSCRPWKAGRTSFVESWKDKVQRMSWDDPEAFRNHMRKFWC